MLLASQWRAEVRATWSRTDQAGGRSATGTSLLCKTMELESGQDMYDKPSQSRQGGRRPAKAVKPGDLTDPASVPDEGTGPRPSFQQTK